MRAIILAGGLGTRLRPFTAVFPKPLVPLGVNDPIPIMEVVVRGLVSRGFDEIAVITGHNAQLIEAYFEFAAIPGAKLSYHRETTPLGTAGGLALFERPSESVLVMNGDILTTLDYSAMHAFHESRGAEATIAAYERTVKIDFGVLEFGADPARLAGYREKPEYAFEVSMGVYILNPSAWDELAPGKPLQMPDLLETLRSKGSRVYCYREPCYWLDIGRHDDYAAANEIFESRRDEFLGRPDLRADPAAALSDNRPHIGSSRAGGIRHREIIERKA